MTSRRLHQLLNVSGMMAVPVVQLFALLHGHSYTAYPIGCAAAVASLHLLSCPESNPNLCSPCRCPKTPRCTAPCGRLLPLWDKQRTVMDLSYHPLVSRVVAVGTVLAVEIIATHGVGAAASGSNGLNNSSSTSSTKITGTGYGSVSAVQVVRRLRDAFGIYARPLGRVVYVMVPPTAPPETATWLAGCLLSALNWCFEQGGGDGGVSNMAGDGVVV